MRMLDTLRGTLNVAGSTRHANMARIAGLLVKQLTAKEAIPASIAKEFAKELAKESRRPTTDRD